MTRGVMPGISYQPLPLDSHHASSGGPAKLWIVVHCTAGSESLTAAEDGASYDQRRTDGTSCHVFADGDSLVQEISTYDRAHAARATGNEYGIHVEICGTYQSRAGWLDERSRPGIRKAAEFIAWAMVEHNIPLQFLDTAELRAHVKGITDHKGITLAFEGTHTDPGPDFPWDVLFTDITDVLNGVEMIDYNQQGPSGSPIAGQFTMGQILNKLMDGVNNSVAIKGQTDTVEEQLTTLRTQVSTLITVVTDLANRPVTGATAEDIVSELLNRLRSTT